MLKANSTLAFESVVVRTQMRLELVAAGHPILGHMSECLTRAVEKPRTHDWVVRLHVHRDRTLIERQIPIGGVRLDEPHVAHEVGEYDWVALVPTVAPRLVQQNRFADRLFDLRIGRVCGDSDRDLRSFTAAPLNKDLRTEQQAADQKEIEERAQHQVGG